MNSQTRFKRSDVPFKDFEQDGVLLDPESGEFYMLDNICHFIWTRLDGEKSLTQVAEEIASEYDVSTEEALKDLQEFMAELESKRLITKIA